MTDIKSAGSWSVRSSLPAGAGLVGSLLILLGLLNALHGVAAVVDADFLEPSPRLMVGTLLSGGVVVLVVAAVQVVCGVGLFRQAGWARWVAVGLIAVDTVVQMIVMPEYPLWSVIIIGVNLFALYALFARYQGTVENVGPTFAEGPAHPMDSSTMPFPR